MYIFQKDLNTPAGIEKRFKELLSQSSFTANEIIQSRLLVKQWKLLTGKTHIYE